MQCSVTILCYNGASAVLRRGLAATIGLLGTLRSASNISSSSFFISPVLLPTSPPPSPSSSPPQLPQDPEDLTRFSGPQIAFVPHVFCQISSLTSSTLIHQISSFRNLSQPYLCTLQSVQIVFVVKLYCYYVKHGNIFCSRCRSNFCKITLSLNSVVLIQE